MSKYIAAAFISLLSGISFSQFGAIDPTFQTTFVQDELWDGSDMTLQPDGKILISGSYLTFSNTSAQALVRFMPDGSLDNTFSLSVDPVFSTVKGTILLPDNRIIIYGAGSQEYPYSVRILNADGSYDESFYPDTVFCPRLIEAAVYDAPNNRLIVVGYNPDNSGTSVQRIACLDMTTGELDPSYDQITLNALNSQNSFPVRSLTLLNNGEAIVTGPVTSFNGSAVEKIIKINTDGTLSSIVFDIQENFLINGVALQNDGKLLVYGSEFGESDIIRLNADGSRDTSFDDMDFTAGLSPDNYIYHCAADNENRILVLTKQDCNLIQGVCAAGKLSRLLPDGAIDNSFSSGSGFRYGNNPIEGVLYPMISMAFQPDGEILAFGYFTYYNGHNVSYLVRIGEYTSELEAFSTSSVPDPCNGSVYMTLGAPAPVSFDLGNGQTLTSPTGYAEINNVCPGIYEAHATDASGTDYYTTVIVGNAEDDVYNNPFPEDQIDTLTAVITNCDIDYESIMSAEVSSFTLLENDSLEVVFTFIDATDTTDLSVIYHLGSGNGNYLLQLQVYCPDKSVPGVFVFTQSLAYSGSNVNLSTFENSVFNLDLFPNPTSGKITIRFDENNAALTIRDINGKALLSKTVSSDSEIDLSGFADGVYLFEILTEKGTRTRRVVKN